MQPREDGLFLVRESTNFPGDYTLCVCYKNKVEHYRVIYKENQLTIDEEEYFENLSRLVKVLLTLTHPCTTIANVDSEDNCQVTIFKMTEISNQFLQLFLLLFIHFKFYFKFYHQLLQAFKAKFPCNQYNTYHRVLFIETLTFEKGLALLYVFGSFSFLIETPFCFRTRSYGCR